MINVKMQSYVMNANLHYLKANILAAQGQLSQAAVEYEYALHSNPSPGVKTYCEQALVTIQSTPSTSQPAPLQVNTQSARPNTNSIDKQARHEVRRTQKQAAATSSQVAAEAAEYQQHHAARTSSIVNGMQNAGFYDHDGDWQPMYGPADIAVVQAKRQARENSVVNGYAQARQNNQAASDQRSSAVLDAAEGLKSQMAVPVRRGEAALEPGTSNLFVRNYESTSSPPSTTATPKPATVTVP